MKSIYKKIIGSAAVVVFITFFFTNLFSFDDGFVGLTKRNGGVGCVCHGHYVPEPSVHVFFVMPDSVAVNQTIYPKLKIVGGPHINAGLDVAVWRGTVDTTYLEPGIRKEMYHYSVSDSGFEVTHTVPKPFVNDTATFTFKYKAPATAGWDTLYANGNSVNGNLQPDTLDAWNFADNKPVKIYIPIGIENISTIASDFSLAQNYPNPFNPVTQITFSLKTESSVTLEVFDITGRLVRTIVNQNLKAGSYKTDFEANGIATGIYFYRLRAIDVTGNSSKSFSETKKMILTK